MSEQNYITAVLGLAINADGKFLLTQRHQPDNQDVHLKWQFPGGGIEFGETPEQTLSRELQEELNVSAQLLDPRPLVKSHVWEAKVAGHPKATHASLLLYLVKITSPLEEIKLDAETHAFGWFSVAEIANLDMLPKSHEFISEAQELIKRNLIEY